jgi:CHASE1-domain containing sensor protein
MPGHWNKEYALSKPQRPAVRLLLAGTTAIGLLISLVLFFTFRNLEKQNTQTAFERFAQERFDGLEERIALSLHDVVALGAFLDFSPPANRDGFARFATS